MATTSGKLDLKYAQGLNNSHSAQADDSTKTDKFNCGGEEINGSLTSNAPSEQIDHRRVTTEGSELSVSHQKLFLFQ